MSWDQPHGEWSGAWGTGGRHYSAWNIGAWNGGGGGWTDDGWPPFQSQTQVPAKSLFLTAWEQATTVGGPKGGNGLPLESRGWLLRETVKLWNEGRESPSPEVHIPVVPMLSWTAEIQDAANYILLGVQRKAQLRQLGDSPERVVATLVESLRARPDHEVEQLVKEICDKASPGTLLLEAAVDRGFILGQRLPLAGKATLPTGRGGASVVAEACPRQPQCTSPGDGRMLGRRSTDEELQHLEKKRRIANLQVELAARDVEAARLKHEAATLESHSANPSPSNCSSAETLTEASTRAKAASNHLGSAVKFLSQPLATSRDSPSATTCKAPLARTDIEGPWP